ncbi:unnamed protein product, partial [Durusdinium trenchii]
AELGVAPLVDMGPLLGKRKKDQNDKAPPKANGDRDTLPLFLLPATKETLRSTASSLAFVASLSDVASLEAVEQELGRTWLGQALHLGYCFLIKNEVWLSLGFCQFAALMWKLEAVQVAEGWEQVFFCESGAFGDSELRWFTVCELREGRGLSWRIVASYTLEEFAVRARLPLKAEFWAAVCQAVGVAVPHAGVRAEDGVPFARALVQHFEP